MRRLIAGNWKMNGLTASLAEIGRLEAMLAENPPACEVLICPPATLMAPMRDALTGEHIVLGGQDCHPKLSGPYTGDISAAMLADAGAAYVTVGHSERRTAYGEPNELVRAKAEAGLAAGLIPIVCVGETAKAHREGRAMDYVMDQLVNSLPAAENATYVVGYEPVWAVGTGKVPAEADIAPVLAAIREHVGPDIRILYGGSMTAANAGELLAIDNVAGGLIGGASLKAADFHGIIRAAC